MSDPYRITDADERPPAATPSRPGTAVTTALWTFAAVGLGLNTALSVAGYPWIASAFGGVTVVCLVTLLVRHLRGRRRS